NTTQGVSKITSVTIVAQAILAQGRSVSSHFVLSPAEGEDRGEVGPRHDMTKCPIRYDICLTWTIDAKSALIALAFLRAARPSAHDDRFKLVHVPKCGEQLYITVLFTHCERLFGSCAGNGTMSEFKSNRPDCDKFHHEYHLVNLANCLLHKDRAVLVDCDQAVSAAFDGKTSIWNHDPRFRKYAPMGVIVSRRPFRRALSAFKFGGGHFGALRWKHFETWWEQKYTEQAPPSFELQGLKLYWKDNFTRCLMFPGVQGCQMQMLLGHICNEPVLSSMNHSLAVDILMRDFKYVGITDYNVLSVALYHIMYGHGWTVSPCPQEAPSTPVRATTKIMSIPDRKHYFQEFIYSAAVGILLRNSRKVGLTSGADLSGKLAAEVSALFEESASTDAIIRGAPPPWVRGADD
ncbi:unnamed protein product, partial [Prorocentrum cordatum]